ncbi:MarR family winged helix-turn-helix transcriptional regulator [Leucobacter chromiireducens]|uniref:MarR family winged helix-turn-helix transcriptional regulator n=1 Tax=Leucobacter chromiireducens TaxID=283877 RepID=UPI000F638BAB|nr:MarR family transcriptional regulator [Leucobacter chromiireducens]
MVHDSPRNLPDQGALGTASIPLEHATPIPSTGDTGAVLLALTRLISHWSSPEMQRGVTAAAGISLDPVAVRALYLLGIAAGDTTPSALASDLRLSRPSTSKLITRMEAQGLLARSATPRDRRSVRISLSAQGQEIFAELFRAGVAMITAATLEWDPRDRQALTALLPRFAAGLLTTPPQ